MILLVALVSICAFLCFKSHQMHCWIPVICHRAQTQSAAPHVFRSRNPLDERVVNTERGPFWLTWLEIATIRGGWGHMCYDSCGLTTYVIRSLQAEDMCCDPCRLKKCATIPAGWRHMCYDPCRLRTYVYSSKEEIRIVPVAKDYICRSF
jgi:hypothetical protein